MSPPAVHRSRRLFRTCSRPKRPLSPSQWRIKARKIESIVGAHSGDLFMYWISITPIKSAFVALLWRRLCHLWADLRTPTLSFDRCRYRAIIKLKMSKSLSYLREFISCSQVHRPHYGVDKCRSFYTKQVSSPCHVSAAHSRCSKYPPAAATHSSARRRVCRALFRFTFLRIPPAVYLI